VPSPRPTARNPPSHRYQCGVPDQRDRPPPAAALGDPAAIETWLKGYDAALNAKDLDKLATFYHPDVTIYEDGGINNGWIDYRDRHLGPELKAFENLEGVHSGEGLSSNAAGRVFRALKRRVTESCRACASPTNMLPFALTFLLCLWPCAMLHRLRVIHAKNVRPMTGPDSHLSRLFSSEVERR